MKNIKRDLIIVALIVISSLSGCFSSQLPMTSTQKTTEIISEDYLSMNIDNVYKFLNDDNLVEAEQNLNIFRGIKLPVEIEKLFFLADGIIALHNERYIQAEEAFNRSLPLTEAVIGLVACKLNIRNASDLTFVEDIFKEIPQGYCSNIYKYFSDNYVRALYAYHLYWTDDSLQYEDIIEQVEIKNLINSNPLVDKIINQLSNDVQNMSDNIVEE
ncbi:MAG: hypothetical protein C0601_11635 [Candidatus Muiribacterium halophilum]|uniref:Lipoprotein n=1 Tax=Muiribacterium halophilum TaxID=2053465 RepID=A0A2N5ZBG4_MUIH1|nr:MAG: hypothetical protein C0601_11635 [Candidatus Muirbacterium halophilum]